MLCHIITYEWFDLNIIGGDLIISYVAAYVLSVRFGIDGGIVK